MSSETLTWSQAMSDLETHIDTVEKKAAAFDALEKLVTNLGENGMWLELVNFGEWFIDADSYDVCPKHLAIRKPSLADAIHAALKKVKGGGDE